jgi:ribosome-associated protein
LTKTHVHDSVEVLSTKPASVVKLIRNILENHKAEDTVIIDLHGKTTIGDYMVITSGNSNRQVKALAENLVQTLKSKGLATIKPEGLPQGDWVLIDAGNVIVHLFRPEVRAFYNLEKMWEADLPDPETETTAH